MYPFIDKIRFHYVTKRRRRTKTTVEVVLKNGEVLTGATRRHSGDQENRRVARREALTDAFRPLDRPARSALWKQIWDRGIRKP